MKKYTILLLLILFIPLFVVAQDNGVQTGDDVLRILGNITTWLWRAFMIITVIVFLITGFFYLTAGGNPNRITMANNMIKYGIIGVVVALLAGGMVQLIQGFLET